MDSPASPDRPRTRDGLVFRPLDEEWVVFDPVADKLHALNLTAALVWTHCTGDATLDEIAAAVGEVFEPAVEGTAILSDVREAVERFRAEGLLV
jgi:hypothetical protein